MLLEMGKRKNQGINFAANINNIHELSKKISFFPKFA